MDGNQVALDNYKQKKKKKKVKLVDVCVVWAFDK